MAEVTKRVAVELEGKSSPSAGAAFKELESGSRSLSKNVQANMQQIGQLKQSVGTLATGQAAFKQLESGSRSLSKNLQSNVQHFSQLKDSVGKVAVETGRAQATQRPQQTAVQRPLDTTVSDTRALFQQTPQQRPLVTTVSDTRALFDETTKRQQQPIGVPVPPIADSRAPSQRIVKQDNRDIAQRFQRHQDLTQVKPGAVETGRAQVTKKSQPTVVQRPTDVVSPLTEIRMPSQRLDQIKKSVGTEVQQVGWAVAKTPSAVTKPAPVKIPVEFSAKDSSPLAGTFKKLEAGSRGPVKNIHADVQSFLAAFKKVEDGSRSLGTHVKSNVQNFGQLRESVGKVATEQAGFKQLEISFRGIGTNIKGNVQQFSQLRESVSKVATGLAEFKKLEDSSRSLSKNIQTNVQHLGQLKDSVGKVGQIRDPVGRITPLSVSRPAPAKAPEAEKKTSPIPSGTFKQLEKESQSLSKNIQTNVQHFGQLKESVGNFRGGVQGAVINMMALQQTMKATGAESQSFGEKMLHSLAWIGLAEAGLLTLKGIASVVPKITPTAVATGAKTVGAGAVAAAASPLAIATAVAASTALAIDAVIHKRGETSLSKIFDWLKNERPRSTKLGKQAEQINQGRAMQLQQQAAFSEDYAIRGPAEQKVAALRREADEMKSMGRHGDSVQDRQKTAKTIVSERQWDFNMNKKDQASFEAMPPPERLKQASKGAAIDRELESSIDRLIDAKRKLISVQTEELTSAKNAAEGKQKFFQGQKVAEAGKEQDRRLAFSTTSPGERNKLQKAAEQFKTEIDRPEGPRKLPPALLQYAEGEGSKFLGEAAKRYREKVAPESEKQFQKLEEASFNKRAAQRADVGEKMAGAFNLAFTNAVSVKVEADLSNIGSEIQKQIVPLIMQKMHETVNAAESEIRRKDANKTANSRAQTPN